MRYLLIFLLLFAGTAFGEITDAEKAEMDAAADRAMKMANAEFADEIARMDSVIAARTEALRELAAWKGNPYNIDYSNFTPDAMKFKVSLRSPSIGEQTDFLFGGEIEWQYLLIDAEWERENGYSYVNYKIDFGNEGQKGNRWEFVVNTRASQARDISRQKVVCRRKVWFAGIGVAAVADSYDFNQTKGVADFRIGNIRYLTNFTGLEIWDIRIEFKEKSDQIIKPFLAGKFYQIVGGESDWQVQVGVEIDFKEDE